MNEQERDNTVETTSPPTFTHKVGGITYKVNVHFNENSTETMDSKIKRMILADCENSKDIITND